MIPKGQTTVTKHSLSFRLTRGYSRDQHGNAPPKGKLSKDNNAFLVES